MVLYVDETECYDYFIVTGLLVKSRGDVELAYKRLCKKAHRLNISPKKKAELFMEFKSTLIDRDYQQLKRVMLAELGLFEHGVIYTCHIKKDKVFYQRDKERAYLNMLSRIVSSIKENTDVVFDRFNKTDFEANIIKKLSSANNVNAVYAADSQREPGIKFVDNLCSVIRLHKTNTDYDGFYQIIENSVVEV